MLNYPYFVLLNAFIWILAIAAVPQTLYRADTRSPAVIKRAGGFTSRASDRKHAPEGDIFTHVQSGTNRFDGFVSTSCELGVARGIVKNGWVYYIDTTGGKFIDVAEEYRKKGKTYGHASEKECASEGNIPWSAIIKWEEMKDRRAISSQTRQDFDNPSKIPRPVPRPAPPKPASPRPASPRPASPAPPKPAPASAGKPSKIPRPVQKKPGTRRAVKPRL
jgi:hypothetical protein